jgi:hypothetical protein
MECLIPGCTADARNKLSIRCRKPSTLAVWAPDSEAYLCRAHAEKGVAVNVDIEPTTTGTVTVTYGSAGQAGPTRTTPIKRNAA